MNKFKRILALSVIFVILFTVSSYAGEYNLKILREDGEADSVIQKIYVEGKLDVYAENEQITLKILPEATVDENLPSGYLLIDQVFVNEDGSFVFEKELDAEPQNIRIDVTSISDSLSGEQVKYFPSTASIEEFKNGLNNNTISSEQAKEKIINDNINLVFDTVVYNMLSESAKIKVFDDMKAETSVFSIGNIYELFNKYTLLNALSEKTNSSDIRIATEYYEKILNLKNEPIYPLFSSQFDNVKNEIYGFMGKFTYTNLDDIKAKFHEGTILSAIKNVSSHLNIYDILNNNKTFLGIDSEVNIITINESLKDLVLRYIVLEKNSINSVTDLKSKITFAISNEAAVRQYVTGIIIPQGGGSGGGGGGGADIIVDQPLNNNSNEMTTSAYFNDINNVPWASDAIRYLYDNSIVKGKSLGVFAPDDKVTRAEMVKMIVEGMNVYDATADCNFSDIKNHWAYKFCASAYKKGYISGITKDYFGADEFITRQDAVVILYRVLALNAETDKIEDVTSSVKYTDSDQISEYASGSIIMMNAYGLVSGYEDNTFRPKKNLTRAEAAVLIYRFLNK